MTYPNTLWTPTPTLSGTSLVACAHCDRPIEDHGVPEFVARRLGFNTNQAEHVCLPPGYWHGLFAGASVGIEVMAAAGFPSQGSRAYDPSNGAQHVCMVNPK